MKTHAANLTLAVATAIAIAATLTLPTGCKSLTPEQKIALAASVAGEAAFVGTAADLERHPDHAAAYRAAEQALRALESEGLYDPALLKDALLKLPIDELRGSTGAIVIGSIVSVYTIGAGFVDLNSAPASKAVFGGIADGIARGLAYASPASGTRALRASLPKQISVPQR